MVHPIGLEPTTHSLGNCSSIQLLSYVHGFEITVFNSFSILAIFNSISFHSLLPQNILFLILIWCKSRFPMILESILIYITKDRIYSYYLSIKSRFRKYLTIKLFLYNNKLVKTRIIHHYFCLMCFAEKGGYIISISW